MQTCLRLNTGSPMPMVGLGTFLLKGERAKTVVEHAIGLGYRHIDTALSYQNEKEIGDVIKSMENSGKINRKDLFITTKVPPVYLAPNDVKMSADWSLENLGTNYVDLLLLHSPWGMKNTGKGNFIPTDDQGNRIFEHHNILDAWRSLEEVFWSGKAKAIGLSNFTPRQIGKIMQISKVPPANLQLECNAYNQQKELESFCRARSITMTAFGPIGAPGRPSHHRVGDDADVDLLEDNTVKTIAVKHQKTEAQVLLKFLLQKGFIIIPKTENLDRLEENVDLFRFNLDVGDMKMLDLLDRRGKYRLFKFLAYSKHPEFFKKEPF